MINNNGYWPYTLKVGDIVRFASGDLRVVRDAVAGKSGYTIWAVFAIRRRSWTNRAYTNKSYVDLAQQGARPVGKMKRMDSELDIRLAESLKYENRFMENQRVLAHDVIGVAP